MNKLLVIGNSYIEMILNVESLPAADTMQIEDKYDLRPGGKACNCAIAASRLGLDVVVCTTLGKDGNGSRLMSFYKNNGIDTRFIRSDIDKKTGLSILLHETDFDSNRRIVYPGANTVMSYSQLEDAFSSCPDGAYISLDLPFEIITKASEICYRNDIPLFVEASPAKSGYHLEDLVNVEAFIMNLVEAQIFSGMRIYNTEFCLRACMKISQKVKARYYIVRMGDKGVFVYDGKYHNVVIHGLIEDPDSVNSVYVDVESAIFASSYMLTGDVNRAALLSSVAGYMVRNDESVRIPSKEQIQKFCVKNKIKF